MRASDDPLDWMRDGAARLRRAIDPHMLGYLRELLKPVEAARAGVRLYGVTGLETVLSATGAIGGIAARRLGVGAKPVRAIVFDKTRSTNWVLGWHQDRTIIVKRRLDVAGFGPWSLKESLIHVEPPIALLNDMITLRVHLDEVGPDNAPLRIARGSHRFGRVPVAEIRRVVASSELHSCHAEAGDVWEYATPIVHASAAALAPVRRRVLQVDYANFDLPGGLKWRGI